MKTILVTGGAGFIGSNFIHHLLSAYDYHVVNLDLLTYAGNLDNLRDIEGDPRYRFVHGDICDAELVDGLVREADAVVNFAPAGWSASSIPPPTRCTATSRRASRRARTIRCGHAAPTPPARRAPRCSAAPSVRPTACRWSSAVGRTTSGP